MNPSSHVKLDTVEKAVSALLKWREKEVEKRTAQLLEHDDFVYLFVTLKKIPQGRTNPDKIALPHPIIRPETDNSEVCLIIDDRTRSKITKEDAKKKIKAENIPIAKVLKLSKLESNYKPYEAKRKLCDSYDMFFADKSVIPLLPRLLGKAFFVKRKLPVPVHLAHKNWKQQIGKIFGSALLYLRTGTSTVVKVARVSMSQEKIAQNVLAAIHGIAQVIPRNWDNIRSLHLKLPESIALPIYQTVPDLLLKIESGKDEAEKALEKESKAKTVKKSGPKKKGRIHEIRYLDSNIGEVFDEDELVVNSEDELSGGENTGDEKVGNAEIGGKKRKKGSATKSSTNSKKVKNSEEEAGEGEDSENDKIGSVEIGGKKKKKVAATKSLKKLKKVKDELVVNSEEELGQGEDSENDKIGSVEIGGKKKKKGAVTKSLKKSKKVKDELVVNGEEEFGQGEDDKIGSAENVGKKKRKGDAPKSLKKSKKVKKEDGLKQKIESFSEDGDEELVEKKKKKKSAFKKSKATL